LMCCVAPVPFLVGYFNFEDVGLCEGGVYYYGDIIVWDKLARYSFVGNTLVLAMNKRTFGFNDKYYISFIIKDDDKSEIEEFLCDRI